MDRLKDCEPFKTLLQDIITRADHELSVYELSFILGRDCDLKDELIVRGSVSVKKLKNKSNKALFHMYSAFMWCVWHHNFPGPRHKLTEDLQKYYRSIGEEDYFDSFWRS